MLKSAIEEYAPPKPGPTLLIQVTTAVKLDSKSKLLNEIGEKLSKKYTTKYFYSDFKKKQGIDRAIELRKKYNMYNQLYCGCIYSYQNYLKK